MDIGWIDLAILVANTVITFLTHLKVSKKV